MRFEQVALKNPGDASARVIRHWTYALDGKAMVCEHEFEDVREAPITGTRSSRACTRCLCVEVLLDTGEWMGLDVYLDERYPGTGSEP